ncbi:hypothetical protein XI05_13375 [Bradyrhizobium sp. CCBAU 11357]|nr:hypothetical protein [Bradyrhizobium sp. CCBAU 11357]
MYKTTRANAQFQEIWAIPLAERKTPMTNAAYHRTRCHSLMFSGMPRFEGSPFEGQEHVPFAKSSAAEDGEA